MPNTNQILMMNPSQSLYVVDTPILQVPLPSTWKVTDTSALSVPVWNGQQTILLTPEIRSNTTPVSAAFANPLVDYPQIIHVQPSAPCNRKEPKKIKNKRKSQEVHLLYEGSDLEDPNDLSWKPVVPARHPTSRCTALPTKKIHTSIKTEPETMDKKPFSRRTNKKIFKCPLCYFVTDINYIIDDHYLDEHRVPGTTYSCLVCNVEYNSGKSFFDHFENHPNGRLVNNVKQETATSERQNYYGVYTKTEQ
ncbi:hypothetical protein NPIL_645541 [Nephila pilipes]|uniref:C2H2-type domain-containing protein n=1 Tax=Nephila pilipes TaxID=299642 RepID=A0A8X6P3W8_NEPPI|nr:hypothetical protein NPIL_645541 [Nephila pilipes]